MKASEIVLGFDFGDTVESMNEHGFKVENPRAMEVIARCVRECKGAFMISKVNQEQLMEVVVWAWQFDFFGKTKLPTNNLRFCETRPDKGPIADLLGVTHMIDDRSEVMAYMPERVNKYLFNPPEKDLNVWGTQGSKVISSWTELEKELFG